MRFSNFFKGLVITTIVTFFVVSCSEPSINLKGSEYEDEVEETPVVYDCSNSTPSESAGSYPTKTPESIVREDITDSKPGVRLELNLIIKQESSALSGAIVDVWHCDAEGNYSQYANSDNFLRGRQTTDAEGKVKFITIFPGWQEGRAPHIYVNITKDGKSKTTQIALPQSYQTKVYQTSIYTKGESSITNQKDPAFEDSLECNLPNQMDTDIVNGGYIIKEVLFF